LGLFHHGFAGFDHHIQHREDHQQHHCHQNGAHAAGKAVKLCQRANDRGHQDGACRTDAQNQAGCHGIGVGENGGIGIDHRADTRHAEAQTCHGDGHHRHGGAGEHQRVEDRHADRGDHHHDLLAHLAGEHGADQTACQHDHPQKGGHGLGIAHCIGSGGSQIRQQVFLVLDVGDQPAIDGVFGAEVAEHHGSQNQERGILQEDQRGVLLVLGAGAVVLELHAAHVGQADAAQQDHIANADLPREGIAQRQKHQRRQDGAHSEAGVQQIGRGRRTAGELIDHPVIEIGDAAPPEADQQEGQKQPCGPTGDDHHQIADEGKRAQHEDGTLLSQPQGHKAADQTGDQVACRVGGDEQAAGGIGQVVRCLQIWHDAAHHQGQGAVAEKGEKAGKQRLLILPVKLFNERKHEAPPYRQAICSFFSIACPSEAGKAECAKQLPIRTGNARRGTGAGLARGGIPRWVSEGMHVVGCGSIPDPDVPSGAECF